MTRIKDTSKTATRIRIIGKSQRLVDPMKVAIALGASEVISPPKQSRGGRNYIKVVFISENGPAKEKRIFELSAEETRDLLFLGAVGGANFSHCASQAGKHRKDFWKRACGYRTFTSRSPHFPFSITFYEKKK